MTIQFLDDAPEESWGLSERHFPLKCPINHKPIVQRWSFLLPEGEKNLYVAFFGAQATTKHKLSQHPIHNWAKSFLSNHDDGPVKIDFSTRRVSSALFELVMTTYWVSDSTFQAWRNNEEVQAWWNSPERLIKEEGCWREILTVPRDRQESIYWKDYPAGLMASHAVDIFPTPYCGYYGAMRDRLIASGNDALDTPIKGRLEYNGNRDTRGSHWKVTVPHNMAVIRSGHSWGKMDSAQLKDYEQKLKRPLAIGMNYLNENASHTGCASLRWLSTTDSCGKLMPENHALGYFLSLEHMERWAEGHPTHAAIFNAAMKRYESYGSANQLRTWHEVFVLPQGSQTFDYFNCHPSTGLLPYFPAVRIK